MIPVIFLTCALALPSTNSHKLLKSMPDYEIDYKSLKDFIEKKRPGKEIVLIAQGELAFDAEWTPMHYRDLRIWIVRKATNLRLVRRAA